MPSKWESALRQFCTMLPTWNDCKTLNLSQSCMLMSHSRCSSRAASLLPRRYDNGCAHLYGNKTWGLLYHVSSFLLVFFPDLPRHLFMQKIYELWDKLFSFIQAIPKKKKKKNCLIILTLETGHYVQITPISSPGLFFAEERAEKGCKYDSCNTEVSFQI